MKNKLGTILREWPFESSSSDKIYTTVAYKTDNEIQLSCNCPGWTRRVAPDGSRSCKHTKQVEPDWVREVPIRDLPLLIGYKFNNPSLSGIVARRLKDGD